MMGTVCSHYAIRKAGHQEYSYTPDEFQAKLVEAFRGVRQRGLWLAHLNGTGTEDSKELKGRR